MLLPIIPGTHLNLACSRQDDSKRSCDRGGCRYRLCSYSSSYDTPYSKHHVAWHGSQHPLLGKLILPFLSFIELCSRSAVFSKSSLRILGIFQNSIRFWPNMFFPTGGATDGIFSKDIGRIIKTRFAHSNTSGYKYFGVRAFYHNSWHKVFLCTIIMSILYVIPNSK